MFSHLVQIKCDQYWPNRGTETYGFIQVTLLDTIELATFCVRTFSLHKVGPGWDRGAVGRGRWWVEKGDELLPWELPTGWKRNHIDPGWVHSQAVTLRMGTLSFRERLLSAATAGQTSRIQLSNEPLLPSPAVTSPQPEISLDPFPHPAWVYGRFLAMQ